MGRLFGLDYVVNVNGGRIAWVEYTNEMVLGAGALFPYD